MVLGRSYSPGVVRWKVVKDTAASSPEYEVGLNLREANTNYVKGDIAFDDAIPTYMRLRCVTAGRTAEGDLSI